MNYESESLYLKNIGCIRHSPLPVFVRVIDKHSSFVKKIIFSIFSMFCFAAIVWAADEPVSWKFDLTETANGEIALTATATIENEWHIYDPGTSDGGPFPTTLEIDKIGGAEKVEGLVAVDSKRIDVYDEIFAMDVGYYEGTAKFVQRFRITDRASFVLKGDIRASACKAGVCTPPLPVSFEFNAKDLPVSGTSRRQNNAESVKPRQGGASPAKNSAEMQVIESLGEGASEDSSQLEAETETAVEPESIIMNGIDTHDLWKPVIEELRAFGAAGYTADRSLLWIFILGFGGGLLALLTPCVWPMIPLTVSFFLKKGKDKATAVKDAVIYGLSIIAIYVGLGLAVTAVFGAGALNSLATNAIFNLIFFALLVTFAVSFFGAFEMRLPSRWTNKMNDHADSTTGLASIFFMAFTLTLVSFSCTGPIIGTLLVDAAGSGAVLAPAIGMIGFAVALAIPFALFAIFPSWLVAVPRSGGWMNAVKVTLGFLELALALKFLSVADLAYGWGLLDREVFLVLWIAIFILLGVYLLGGIRFKNDSELRYVSVPRIFLSIISLAFAFYMIPGLWGAPLKAISAFPPPMTTQDFNLYDNAVHAKFDDYEAGMDYARRNGKPVIVDFSGLGCVNCREMEARVWTDPRVKSILENEYVLITLMVDDRKRLPESVEVEDNGRVTKLKTVGDKWSYLQRHKFGTNSQPYYVLLDQTGRPIGPSYAYDEDIEKYLQFLNIGLSNFSER